MVGVKALVTTHFSVTQGWQQWKNHADVIEAMRQSSQPHKKWSKNADALE